MPLMKCFAVALCLLATPALAEAVTYRGDLNSLPIVVEFSEAPETATGEIYGRYFFISEGIDIPLQATSVSPTEIVLLEEQGCEDENCSYGGDIPSSIPQYTATWTLRIVDDGAALIGGWDRVSIHLERTGTRPYTPVDPASPADLATFATSLLYSGETLTRETSSYDFLKVNVALQHSGKVRADGVEYDYVADPRTLFKYPRIQYVSGVGPGPANAFLEQRDWAMRLDALNCRAMAYPGMGWSDNGGWAYGTLGGYDDETVTVTYLSDKILSWTEGGSLFCGGAHPYNHHELFNLDVQAGKPLDLSRIFKDWIAKDYEGNPVDLEEARTHPDDFLWGPTDALIAFVQEHRVTDQELGLDAESDCPMDELVATNLAIGFTRGHKVLFSLDGLENAIEACGSDLYEAPVADLTQFLTPDARRWFPSLPANP
jgi:hypothetical protein